MPLRAARLRSMLSDTSDAGRLLNAWLLTPSILRAFRNGHLQIRLRGAKNWNTLKEDAGTDESKAEVSISPIESCTSLPASNDLSSTS